MLTRNGWLLGFVAVAFFVAGRALALQELYLLGAGCAALLIASLALLMAARVRLRVGRQVRPVRIHAGQPARVDLSLHNAGRRTPVLRVRDPVSGTRGADLAVGPLHRDETAMAAYRIPTQRRGALTVGPLDVDLTDPFGLASSTLRAAGAVELKILPKVDDVAPVPFTLGHDPHSSAFSAHALGRVGEDFYALRHYTVGDDLKRVHWKSTARQDELMVRQDELPWQGRATVLLDNRRHAYDDDTYEAAVSATASVVVACSRRRDLVRVVTTNGGDSGFGTGGAHVDAILEYLATVNPSEQGTLQAATTTLHRTSAGGALVAVLGSADRPEIDAVLRLKSSYGAVSVVVFPTAAGGSRITPRTTRGRDAATVMVVPPEASFQTTWNRMSGLRPAPVGSTA